MKNYPYVYLLGVGGIGMSALARWFNTQSIQVFGYDRTSSALTDQLIQEGISIHFEDRIEAIPIPIIDHRAQSLVVYTPAISSSNRLLNHLITENYVVHKRAEVLGMITRNHRTLAIAGTHGKTITSALAAHTLHQAGKKIVAFLGGIATGYTSNLLIKGPIDQDTIIIVEADEFDRSFLHLQPHWAIVTTIDPDHLDVYGDIKRHQEAFKSFVSLVPPLYGKAIMHRNVTQQLALEEDHVRIICYSLNGTTIRAENVRIQQGSFYFDYVDHETRIHDIQLTMPGYHHIENALAVITICLILGLDIGSIRRGIATFKGVQRRFEYVMRTEQMIFLDDYAHHPAEITALLQTIRALYPEKEITIVFQPHLYTRTQALASEFAQSLDLADRVFLLDIYPARELPIKGVTSACIFDQITLEKKWMCTPENLVVMLNQQSQPEILVTAGAGNISNLIPAIKQSLLAH